MLYNVEWLSRLASNKEPELLSETLCFLLYVPVASRSCGIGVRTSWPTLVALIVSQIYPTGTVRKILLRRHGRTTHYDPTRSRANHVALDDDVRAYGDLGRCNKSSPHQPLHENTRTLRCGKRIVHGYSQLDSVPNCMPPLLCIPFLAKRTKRTCICKKSVFEYNRWPTKTQAHRWHDKVIVAEATFVLHKHIEVCAAFSMQCFHVVPRIIAAELPVSLGWSA